MLNLTCLSLKAAYKVHKNHITAFFKTQFYFELYFIKD